VCIKPTLERNAPWSRCTASLRSRRQRERPRWTGDSVKIAFLFGTSVPPALPNAHENTSKPSMACASSPHLSGMRLGAGVQPVFVLVDSAKDRDGRAILRKSPFYLAPRSLLRCQTPTRTLLRRAWRVHQAHTRAEYASEPVCSQSSFSSTARKIEMDGRFCENHHFK